MRVSKRPESRAASRDSRDKSWRVRCEPLPRTSIFPGFKNFVHHSCVSVKPFRPAVKSHFVHPQLSLKTYRGIPPKTIFHSRPPISNNETHCAQLAKMRLRDGEGKHCF